MDGRCAHRLGVLPARRLYRGDELPAQRGDDGRCVPRGGPARGARALARSIALGPARVWPGALGGLPRRSAGGLHRVRQVALRWGGVVASLNCETTPMPIGIMAAM